MNNYIFMNVESKKKKRRFLVEQVLIEVNFSF